MLALPRVYCTAGSSSRDTHPADVSHLSGAWKEGDPRSGVKEKSASSAVKNQMCS